MGPGGRRVPQRSARRHFGHPDDRRSAYARSTEPGRQRLRTAAPTYLDGIRRHFTAHMTGTEAETVTRALGKVLAALAGT